MTGNRSYLVCKRLANAMAIISITLGGLIYLGGRPLSLNLFRWCGIDKSNSWLTPFRYWFEGRFPEWMIYELPGGLWALSYVLFVGIIWNCNIRKCIAVGSVIPFIGVVSELLQIKGFLPGNFDVIDFMMYVFGWTIGMGIIYIMNQLNNKRYEDK